MDLSTLFQTKRRNGASDEDNIMIFFFYSREIEPGTVYRVLNGHRNAGKSVVMHQVQEDMLWCYENRPVTYRVNRKGDRVIDFDPACITSPYSPDYLEETNEIPLQDEGWGAAYRRKYVRN